MPGATFAVWAPNARSVSVVGDWNHWQIGADVHAAGLGPVSGPAS